MPRGVANFNGDRLRLARELKRVTSAASLAGSIGLTRQAVAQFEAGTAVPSHETLTTIASRMGFPLAFFLMPSSVGRSGPVFFRSMATEVAAERGRARALLALMHDLMTYLAEYVVFPQVDLPRFGPLGPPTQWTDDQIERAADQTRQYLRVKSGPLPNLAWLVEHCGVLVARTRLADKELDGLSRWISDRPFVLLNDSKSPARSRFDLAHEIAHLVFHDQCDEAHIRDKTTFGVLERQAHRFASALLLPKDEFARDLCTCSLDELRTLKHKWRVSIAAMVRRAADIGFITKEQLQRLQQSIGRRGWRTVEPDEDAVPIEQPALLRYSLELLVKESVATPAQILEALPLPATYIEEIAGLDRSFFDQPPPSRVVPVPTSRLR